MFRVIVQQIEHIKHAYQSGISALAHNSVKIKVRHTHCLEGSVNIDFHTQHLFPNENRWDYMFAYKSYVYFIEVHPAITSEVKIVIAKLSWLKNWLHTYAPQLLELKAERPFYWLQTGNFALLKTSRQYRLACSHGIIPISRLALD